MLSDNAPDDRPSDDRSSDDRSSDDRLSDPSQTDDTTNILQTDTEEECSFLKIENVVSLAPNSNSNEAEIPIVSESLYVARDVCNPVLDPRSVLDTSNSLCVIVAIFFPTLCNVLSLDKRH